jgi:multiple sugar transport system substrate-binding protein
MGRGGCGAPGLRHIRRRPACTALLACMATLVAAGAAACSNGSNSGGVPASSSQTIVFAESGLGAEGQQTQKAIDGFEAANPNIKVSIQVLSSNSTTYLTQLQHDFISGSSTPDVFESDVTYPAEFAQAGWVLPLTQFSPDTSQFFQTEVAAGTYNGTLYAVPWLDNPEGLYYRTDLIKTPPTSPAQVVSDAEAAMKADPALKEGIAFEADKYEGAITAFLTIDSAFGGTLNPQDVDTPGNVAALNWLHSAIYDSHIAPQAVTGWQEGQAEQAFVLGHAAFSIDYPFVEPLATTPPVMGHVGYIPFPAGPDGTPGAALGGEMLAINAKTSHAAAAWKLIQYLTSPQVEDARAIVTGDPPSLPSAYTAKLLAAAPYFAQVKTLNSYAAPRPVSPNYLAVSADLQTLFSSVYANPASDAASSAFAAGAATIESDANATPGS